MEGLDPSWGVSSSAVQKPWLGELQPIARECGPVPMGGIAGVAKSLISGAQDPEPQDKKWASHKLCFYMYHNVLSFFPSYASRSGANHLASFFTSNLHGGPHWDITKFDEGMKKMWWLYIYIYIYFLFGLSYLEVSLYENTFKCNLLPWVKFISSSAEMLYKCGALTVVFEQLSEFSEKVAKYKSREEFRLVFLSFFSNSCWTGFN